MSNGKATALEILCYSRPGQKPQALSRTFAAMLAGRELGSRQHAANLGCRRTRPSPYIDNVVVDNEFHGMRAGGVLADGEQDETHYALLLRAVGSMSLSW